MKRHGLAFFIPTVLTMGFLPAAVHASGTDQPSAPVLAWVDGDPITTRDLDEMLAVQKRRSSATTDVAHLSPDGLLKRLVQNRLLEHEGRRMGVQDRPQVRNQIWELKRHRGMLALLDSVTADVPEPDETELAPVLDRTNTMHRVSHILVDSGPLARALVDSLKAGASFVDFALRYSQDTSWAGPDGDLGWARADLYLPEFQTALEGVEKGGVGDVVKTDDGWHVLLLADTRTETVGQSEAMRLELRDAAMRERVMNEVRAYVESLREKHGVTIDGSLVATLDYESSDPAVMEGLRTSEAVVATMPWRALTVRELTRRIRFDHFHGIEGKPEAAVIRDETVEEWITELVLRHEASALGFDEKPHIVAAADLLERDQIREIVVDTILDFPFAPTPDDLAGYHAAHPDLFTPAPRVRTEAAVLSTEAAARRFREKVEGGAKLRWLAEREPTVEDPRPAAYAGWMAPAEVGLSGPDAQPGTVVGPLQIEGGWAVVRVAEVEAVGLAPLEQCREMVIAAMKSERMQRAMKDAFDRLEAGAEVELAPDVHDTIASTLR